MFKKRDRFAMVCVVGAALMLAAFGVFQAGAQPSPPTKDVVSKEITLTGRVVDLHCAMTGKMSGDDPAKCTWECIRAGVPAGLETDGGLVVLGYGETGPSKVLLAHAYQQVRMTGHLYEKGGIKYFEVASVVNPLGDDTPVKEPKD